VAGCSSNPTDGTPPLAADKHKIERQRPNLGVVDDGKDVAFRVENITNIQLRQACDDIGYILLLDRSSSLSQWHATANR
jgi:hypothetical protein